MGNGKYGVGGVQAGGKAVSLLPNRATLYISNTLESKSYLVYLFRS